MSRYYFHIRDGMILVPDEEGMECRNIVAVQDEVRASVQDLANVALRQFSKRLPASIEVEDDAGNAVKTAPAISWLN